MTDLERDEPCDEREDADATCPFLILGDKDAAECIANGHCGCGAAIAQAGQGEG
jgi:hypothetical protein